MEAKKIIDVTPPSGQKIKTPFIFSSKAGDDKFQLRDYITAGLLPFLIIGLYVFGLGAFEFFRHTEADRTLIGWEMAETGNYLVPKLLSTPILTKPPLYYWTLAAIFTLTGEVTEFYARFPSLVFGALSVAMSFIMLRLGRIRYDFALLSALALGTSALFVQLATKAEIDMTYGFFCWAALYTGFFASTDRSLKWSAFGGALCGLAFLVKGPQILAFYALSQAVYSIYFLRERVGKFLFRNSVAALCFFGVFFAWFVPLSQAVGLDTLAHQFDVEVLQRFTSEASKQRAWYYYIGSVFAGLLPWSIFIIGALLLRWKDKHRVSGLMSAERLFMKYSAVVLVSGLVLLSLSAGKSSRYWFPLFCFGANLCVWAAYYVRGSVYEKYLSQALLVLSAVGSVAGLAIAFFGYFAPGAILFFGSCFVCLKNRGEDFERWKAVVALVLFMGGVRGMETGAFAEHRNESYRVPEIASELKAAIGEQSEIYTIEIFSRWLSFYLKQDGVNTIRLSPETLPRSGEVLVLLDGEHELWRLEALSTYEKVFEAENKKNKWLLVRTDAGELSSLNLRETFPTNFSSPDITSGK